MATVVPDSLPILSCFLPHLLLICSKRSWTWHWLWVVVRSNSYCLCACSRKMAQRFAPNECPGTNYIYGFCDGNSGRQLTNIVDIFRRADSRTGKCLWQTRDYRERGQLFHVTENIEQDNPSLDMRAYWTWRILTVCITNYTGRRHLSVTLQSSSTGWLRTSCSILPTDACTPEDSSWNTDQWWSTIQLG
jgi:hypothetical protein